MMIQLALDRVHYRYLRRPNPIVELSRNSEQPNSSRIRLHDRDQSGQYFRGANIYSARRIIN